MSAKLMEKNKLCLLKKNRTYNRAIFCSLFYKNNNNNNNNADFIISKFKCKFIIMNQ